MSRIKYEPWNPGPDARAIVAEANRICEDYRAQGYDLTLRQLYYQFVARDILPNTQKSYDKLGSIVNKGRMAGLIDWDYIVDRTRNLRAIGHFTSPSDIVRTAARSFALDKWSTQDVHVEVWVEKEALAGVVQQVANRYDVPYFSCRGYVSQSELWGAAQRAMRYMRAGQRIVILHLGDHDPSGIDMTRDITDRMHTFTDVDWLRDHEDEFDDDEVKISDIRRSMVEHMQLDEFEQQPIEVRRIALNFDQVQQYDPPPNPAKLTDSRAQGYIAEHGTQSWELDALEPSVLDALIAEHIEAERDDEAWSEIVASEDEHIELLTLASSRWSDVVRFLRTDHAE